ncbi:hypothetical protein GCM10017712_28360 [Curtobacterium citreum]
MLVASAPRRTPVRRPDMEPTTIPAIHVAHSGVPRLRLVAAGATAFALALATAAASVLVVVLVPA